MDVWVCVMMDLGICNYVKMVDKLRGYNCYGSVVWIGYYNIEKIIGKGNFVVVKFVIYCVIKMKVNLFVWISDLR